ncbi:MAG: NAD(P)H-hydrate epimerase, partial [Candidatus Kapabacteria bacterium]|nr:NAD(P)H-hydrate epimerase [Candidatus Kapabacteria bacterium]
MVEGGKDGIELRYRARRMQGFVAGTARLPCPKHVVSIVLSLSALGENDCYAQCEQTKRGQAAMNRKAHSTVIQQWRSDRHKLRVSMLGLCMRPLLTSQQSRAVDQESITVFGIPSYELMETATSNAAACLQDILGGRRGLRVFVGCGTGNNGGDGFAMARMLAVDHDVTVCYIGNVEKMSPETRRNFELAATCTRIGVWDDAEGIGHHEYDVVIDALLGVGMRLPLDATVRRFCAMLDQFTADLKVSVDVPTGLDATTGEADSVAFHADHTITMVAAKPGFYCNDGPSHVGQVHVVSIGAPDDVVRRHINSFIVESSDVRAWLPPRQRRSSKFDYGRVLVIGGSRGMRGAPALTAHAALVVGAGLVELAAPALHPLVPREVMTCELPATTDGTVSAAALDVLRRAAERATVIALGPGLSDHAQTLATMTEFINGLDPEIPLVIDADGLRTVPGLARSLRTVVLTPHLGEYARLIGVPRDQLRAGLQASAIEHAQRLGCVL